MAYYPDIEFCLKLANVIGYHPFKGFTKIKIFCYSISWILFLCPPTLTIMKLCNGEGITVRGFLGVSINITLYAHALVRTSVLFFGRKQMRALIETTKQFWGMENYEAIVKRTRKGRITYIWITFSFVLSGCLKRHLNLSQTGLYYPRFFSKHVWVLIHDIAEEWGLLGFISYDILVRTLLIQITVQLEMLNKKLLVLYDSKEPESIIRNKLRECVEHYCLLMWFADGVNKLFSKAFLVTFASDIFSCTVSLYMIMGDADVRLLVEGALHIMAALYMLGFCYCIPAQDMDNEISDLSTNAYLSNWQNNIDYRKDILLVIRAMQIPFGISAGSIMPINMQTLLAACKAMVSYCMFLRTVDGSAN